MLSTDEVKIQVDRPDLSDDAEFQLLLDEVGTRVARLLSQAPVLVDAGLRDPAHVDRVLGPTGLRRDSEGVLLVRLTVGLDEAIRRKSTLPEARVRELHEKWQTRPIAGEVVIPTEGASAEEVSRAFERVLRIRFGSLDGWDRS